MPENYGSYDVVILELTEDVDFDLYPQAEPLCLPEYYDLSKSYTNEYSYSYGYGSQYSSYGAGAASPQVNRVTMSAGAEDRRNEEGVDNDLECFAIGYSSSPLERLEVNLETNFALQLYV